MSLTRSHRRRFLAALGAVPFGGLLTARLEGSQAAAAARDYLFAPGLIYLNTAALGPCSRQVIDAAMHAWQDLETDPAGLGYGTGRTLTAAEAVREKAASLLGCAAGDVVITRSTTDGMNAVAQGLHLTSGQRVLTTDQEHDGGTSCWRYLARHSGVGIDTIRIPFELRDPGAIVQRFADAIRNDTRVISVSHVLSSTGLRMPIQEISALASSRGLLCVVDGAQAVGSINVDVKSLGCHAYATSGHKWLMGPKGTGLLYLSSAGGARIEPIQLDDGRAFYSHSSGVGNLPGTIGLGVAIDALQRVGMTTIEQHSMALRNRIYEGLGRLGKATIVSAAPGPLATPVVTFALPDAVDSQVLVQTLREKHKIIVKMVPKRWLNGIRLSPHLFNTEQDVDALLRALRQEL